MRRRASTTAAVAAAAAVWATMATAPAAPARAKSDGPVVEAARQISDNPSRVRAHAIPSVAVDPRNDAVVAVAAGEAYSSTCGVRVSVDGGLSWRDTASAQPPGYPRCMRSNQGSVAGVAFGRDGTLYFAFAGLRPGEWQSRVFLARSHDRGQSWETTALPGLEPDFSRHLSGSHGLPTVAVDPTDARNVYVAWQTNYNLWLTPEVLDGQSTEAFPGRPLVAASHDGGRTFAPPIDAAAGLEGYVVDVHLVVGRNGRVHAFFGDGGFGDGERVPEGHLFMASRPTAARRSPRRRSAPGQAPTGWCGWAASRPRWTPTAGSTSRSRTWERTTPAWW